MLYVYAQEVERRRYDIIFAGLALWLADWVNEIANSLILHLTDRAALWTVTGDTSYLILIADLFRERPSARASVRIAVGQRLLRWS